MNKREAAIISAYTGMLCCPFGDFHKYIEEIMNRPAYTHELASQNIMDRIKQSSEKDFINLCENLTD